MLNPVALVQCKGDLEAPLKEAITLSGDFGCLKSPLIIKPNICTAVDKTGFAVTSVKTVEALINLVLKKDSNISIKIVESDSESKFIDEAFEKLGYKSLEDRFRNQGFDLSLINLSRSPMTKVKLDGLYFKNLALPKILTKARYLISLAMAKTHRLTLITGVLKNLFGFLPRKDQSFYHPYINNVIVDLNRLIRPDLCIIDARVGLEGWAGPKMRRINTLIVGRNPISVDATMARVMGFSPERIHHLVKAKEYDLGDLSPKVLGMSIKSAAVNFRSPSNLDSNALVKLD